MIVFQSQKLKKLRWCSRNKNLFIKILLLKIFQNLFNINLDSDSDDLDFLTFDLEPVLHHLLFDSFRIRPFYQR